MTASITAASIGLSRRAAGLTGGGASGAGRMPVSTNFSSAMAALLPCARRLGRPHPGVQLLVEDLGEDAAEDHDHAGEHAQHHQQVVVVVPGALIGQRAQAGVGEHGLNNIGAPQDVGDGDGHDAEIGRQDVPQAVPEQDLPFSHPL